MDDSTSTLSNPTHAYADTGTYKVCLYTSNECGADTICQNVSITSLTGIQHSTFNIQHFNVFPNPNDGSMTVKFPSELQGKYSITIYNTIGETIFKRTDINDQELLIDITNQPAGVYYISISTSYSTMLRKILLASSNQ